MKLPLAAACALWLAACASHDHPPFEPTLVEAGHGHDLAFTNDRMTMLYHGTSPAGGVSAAEIRLAPKSLGAPPHTHTGEDEYFYVIEGTFLVGAQERPAGPGSYGAMPRRVRHAFWNGSDTPARVLVTMVPGAFAGFFEEVSAAIRAGNLTDRAEIGRLITDHAARHGCTVHADQIGPLVQKHGLR